MNRSTVTAAVLALLAPAAALSVPSTAEAQAAPGRAAAGAAAPFRVSASLSTSEVVAGEDKVRITGRVSPRAAGDEVTLLQRFEGKRKWVRSGKATIRRNGTFVLKDAPDRSGVRYYRVLKPATDGMGKGLSRELELAVWGWGRLVHRAVGAHEGFDHNTAPRFGTKPYYGSLTTTTAGAPGFVEYTLGRTCRSLRATYALTDESATNATGSVQVSVDGATKATHALATGVIVEDHVVDVTGAFRIRFDAVASASPVGTAAIGSPEVLCLD